MSATIFFVVLVLLTVGVWGVALIGLWYGRELLKRQRELTHLLLPYLKKVEKDNSTMQALHIDKNEPIEKYREVTLPDKVCVSFTDTKEEK